MTAAKLIRSALLAAAGRRRSATAIALCFCLIALAPPATAAIVTSGDLTGLGTPYNGVDDPWATVSLRIGDDTPGSLTISGGSDVNNGGFGRIAYKRAASTSSVTVDGDGATWSNSFGLEVGVSGSGALVVRGGGSVSNDNWGFIGRETGSRGTVTVGGGTGSSTWTNSGDLYVGYDGTGALIITGGGSVSNPVGAIGFNFGSAGTATVGGGTGSSSWTNSSYLFVGAGGPGELNVIGGGSVSNTYGSIGAFANGTATVGGGSGASTWTNSRTLFVGEGAAGTLNVNTGGLVIAEALGGGNATSSVNFNGGALRITATDDALNTINLLFNGGTIDVPTAGTMFTLTSAISGAGGLIKTGGATLALSGENSYLGATSIDGGTLLANNIAGSATGSGAVTVNAGCTLGGTGAVGGPVTVNSGGGLAPGASIESLDTGSVILAADSKFKVEIDVHNTPAADLLNVNGAIDLNGSTLDLRLLGTQLNTLPSLTFLIATNDSSDSIAGTFAAVTGLPPDWSAAIDYAYAGTDILGRIGTGNDLAVTLTDPDPVIHLAADFNEDRFVDGDDLATWQAEFGRATGATHAHGDANEDGAVNGADFLTWQQQLGTFPNPPALAAAPVVPEPTPWALVVAALGAALARRRA